MQYGDKIESIFSNLCRCKHIVDLFLHTLSVCPSLPPPFLYEINSMWPAIKCQFGLVHSLTNNIQLIDTFPERRSMSVSSCASIFNPYWTAPCAMGGDVCLTVVVFCMRPRRLLLTHCVSEGAAGPTTQPPCAGRGAAEWCPKLPLTPEEFVSRSFF